MEIKCAVARDNQPQSAILRDNQPFCAKFGWTFHLASVDSCTVMKTDTTTLVLNFVLAALVILGVLFAVLAMNRTHTLRQLQTAVQIEMQRAQYGSARAQALLNEVISYNVTAKSPELAQIIQSAQAPQQPATK
jgi:hypothetical protein